LLYIYLFHHVHINFQIVHISIQQSPAHKQLCW